MQLQLQIKVFCRIGAKLDICMAIAIVNVYQWNCIIYRVEAKVRARVKAEKERESASSAGDFIFFIN